MQDILADLDRWQEEGEEIALATVVRTWGSTPRSVGARFAVTRSGKISGSVSGGCVEADLFEQAMAVLDKGKPALIHYGIDDEMAFQVGLSCGGSIEVFVEPFRNDEAWRTVRRCVLEQKPGALTIGLAPAPILGHRLAVIEGDQVVGSVDRELDDALVAEAQRLVLTGGAKVISLPHGGEEAAVFVEAFAPRPHLLIVGATHIAIPLCQMAKLLGYRVSVVDARPAFATGERFPQADDLLIAWPEEALNELGLDPFSYVAILTHDPKFDIPTLTRALRSEARYIGVMGSRGTHTRRKRRLQELGFAEEDIDRIHAPIGLDLGAQQPEEIALAILAEITAVRYRTDAEPLKGKTGHIHPHADGASDKASKVSRIVVKAKRVADQSNKAIDQ